MALTARPKPSAHHRKRQAEHHHHGKSYLETYWPYLPMLAVVAGGAVINRALYGNPSPTTSAGAAISGQAGSSRIQSLFGTQSDKIFVAALMVTAAILVVFIVSHWYRLHRLITKGEAYIIAHPRLEIGAVLIITVGFVLTRSVGSPS